MIFYKPEQRVVFFITLTIKCNKIHFLDQKAIKFIFWIKMHYNFFLSPNLTPEACKKVDKCMFPTHLDFLYPSITHLTPFAPSLSFKVFLVFWEIGKMELVRFEITLLNFFRKSSISWGNGKKLFWGRIWSFFGEIRCLTPKN